MAIRYLRDVDKQRNVHKKYHMAEISEWGYKPEVMFNFQVKSNGDLEAFVEFSLRDGKVISDLLTDYALAYIKVSSVIVDAFRMDI